jgi:hypothetical protein
MKKAKQKKKDTLSTLLCMLPLPGFGKSCGTDDLKTPTTVAGT